MRAYRLKFLPAALREWKKLGANVREQFKKKLMERLKHPKVESAKLSGFKDIYKIKLRSVGYRLAYRVCDGELIVIVLAVGKREKGAVYDRLQNRID